MATLTTVVASAAGPSIAVKGLGSGRSLAGTKLSIRPTRRTPAMIRSRARVVAKYGDKSVYFDLEDLPNTTGQWDLYGSDAPSPYNPLQSKFFETFAAPFTKRGLLLKFSILVGGVLLAYVSATAPDDLLPDQERPTAETSAWSTWQDLSGCSASPRLPPNPYLLLSPSHPRVIYHVY
ncbi:hypothetical protein HPP92_021150 [Vanilla planifolia]|uniref:Photosystem I reaction center subunit VI n=1 Tax=Vanilla planifolia TaxID=51239 RepID=A0A835Q425_VANPL|nr:hypothetical protein HPP92_021150 [Vanilla planifolia]